MQTPQLLRLGAAVPTPLQPLPRQPQSLSGSGPLAALEAMGAGTGALCQLHSLPGVWISRRAGHPLCSCTKEPPETMRKNCQASPSHS